MSGFRDLQKINYSIFWNQNDPLYMQHYMMLSRNLLYTGLTRAKKLAIVIGSKKAISLAVRSTDDVERYTRLQQRLVLLGKLYE